MLAQPTVRVPVLQWGSDSHWCPPGHCLAPALHSGIGAACSGGQHCNGHMVVLCGWVIVRAAVGLAVPVQATIRRPSALAAL